MSFTVDGDSELIRLTTEEDFITFNHCDNLKSYMVTLFFIFLAGDECSLGI
jgi:hypothetical protein